jgi:dynein heavy chain
MKLNCNDELSIKNEVERLVRIENNVQSVPDFINIGPVCLKTDPIKISLKSFSFAWKSRYASKLHDFAKTKLKNAIEYRENIKKRLNINVQTLEQLNDALKLIEELSDMENKIDKIYFPIENLYDDLKRYDIVLDRDELDEVYNLRLNWLDLMKSAENVRILLLHDKRNALEQELDKQVKTFVVEVIRFRNLFDAQGPCVHGIEPDEAVRRLGEFQIQYDNHDMRRKTLDSISILFGLQCKPFAELDKTGDELLLLNQLYAVYQKFLNFDKHFKLTLWSEIDLIVSIEQIDLFWLEFCNLPAKLQENWDAYYELENSLVKYRSILPILLLLNNKEIRNRHWLQVMQVTKSTFILESSQFRLNDIMDIGLELYKLEIEEICKSAKKEQELENKMRTIEEEWNEQVLNFTNYKEYGEVCLDKDYTMRLLEQLDDAQESLVLMLSSKYVQPLRDEVSTWSEKLKTIAEVLELWIEVQDLWINMECVFSNPQIIRDMPNEAKRFSRVDKSWIRSQKQSFDMKSVLQCCLGKC